MPTDPSANAPGNTIRMMDLLEEDLGKPENQAYARIVHNAQELKAATDIRPPDPSFRTAVVHCVEGGHGLGGDIARLDELARRGVAMVTVTHFFHKGIGSAGNSFPFFPDASGLYPNVGLSDLGRRLVRRLAELDLIIDVSHGTRATIEDILGEVCCPLVASHASALTLADHPYSLHDDHIKQIAHNGGIIGVILMPYWLSNYSTEAQALEYGDLNEVLRWQSSTSRRLQGCLLSFVNNTTILTRLQVFFYKKVPFVIPKWVEQQHHRLLRLYLRCISRAEGIFSLRSRQPERNQLRLK